MQYNSTKSVGLNIGSGDVSVAGISQALASASIPVGIQTMVGDLTLASSLDFTTASINRPVLLKSAGSWILGQNVTIATSPLTLAAQNDITIAKKLHL